MHEATTYVRRALEAGAAGFVLKHSAPAELIAAIRAVLDGKTFIAPALAGAVLRDVERGALETSNGDTSLTPRQREVPQFLAEGRSAKSVRSSFTNTR